MVDVRPVHRAPLLALGLASLVAGVLGGLIRVGWRVPWPPPSATAAHGALMVPAFFGAVIALERAVAIAQRWAYVGPLAAGLGGVMLVLGAPEIAAKALLGIGSAALVAASIVVVVRQHTLFTFAIASGAGCLLAGNVIWLAGATLQAATPWWLAFLVLTIAGERLELSRLLRRHRGAMQTFAFVAGTLVVGVAAMSVRVYAVGLGGLALWLAWHDVAWRTVRTKGLPRFIAVCLLVGYAWLAVSAGISFIAGMHAGTLACDAAIHTLVIGFVLSMVLGHAPIIVPAIVRVAVPYHPTFYVPLVLLHASLLVRVMGDAEERYDWRAAGGALNGVAILSFIVSTLIGVARGRREAAG